MLLCTGEGTELGCAPPEGWGLPLHPREYGADLSISEGMELPVQIQHEL